MIGLLRSNSESNLILSSASHLGLPADSYYRSVIDLSSPGAGTFYEKSKHY